MNAASADLRAYEQGEKRRENREENREKNRGETKGEPRGETNVYGPRSRRPYAMNLSKTVRPWGGTARKGARDE